MADQQWYTREERKLLLKERYFTSSHNYFFEVKEAKNGSKYIVVDQRKKVGDQFISAKMRIFEDEMLEFQRILQKLVQFSHSQEQPIIEEPQMQSEQLCLYDADLKHDADLRPAFFSKLSSEISWKEFEEHTFYLLKLLGISAIYNFLGERQAGKADGFFKIGNLAVIYDCTLNKSDIEIDKSEQINNYCNRLKQGRIELSETTTEEFYGHHKQVWIITQGITRPLKIVNSIEVKEVAVQDIMVLYQERLTTGMSEQSLEIKLHNL